MEINYIHQYQQKYFSNVKVIGITIMLTSSDDFCVATTDGTSGKDTDFSLVGCSRNK